MVILVVVAILLAYFKMRRSHQTQSLDGKGRSAHIHKLEAMSTAGANFVIRHSMADSGNRNSRLLFRSNPSSERCPRWRSGPCRCNGFVYSSKRFSLANVPSPASRRISAFENRVSRVSFADDLRPTQSTESRCSRAYHLLDSESGLSL